MSERVSDEWLVGQAAGRDMRVLSQGWLHNVRSALIELWERRAQRCETCGEWMTVGGPDECPWMFGICPEQGYCFHWKSREEPQPCQ